MSRNSVSDSEALPDLTPRNSSCGKVKGASEAVHSSGGRAWPDLIGVSATPLYLQFLYELVMKSLQVVHGRLLDWPSDDEALVVAGRRLGNDVEMDMVDLLVGDATVVLDKRPIDKLKGRHESRVRCEPEGGCRDRKSTRLNSSHSGESRMPSSA